MFLILPYFTALPPSQTAPETVSLLQQPVQNSKYASTVVLQGRSGYSREKPRSRLSHYPNQMANNHYQSYSPLQSPVQVSPQGFDARPAVRHSPPQMQYLQPNTVDYKANSPNPLNSRSFKLPSPPLVPVTTQQVSCDILNICYVCINREVILSFELFVSKFTICSFESISNIMRRARS